MDQTELEAPVVVCCHCCRVEDGGWVPLDPRFAPGDRAVAHVVCPDCVTEYYAPRNDPGNTAAA